MSGVLGGVRVLDFGRFIAGPFAATILGEPISLKDGIALVIIMSGILAVQISHRRGLIQ